MKKCICITFALILLISSIGISPAFAEDLKQVNTVSVDKARERLQAFGIINKEYDLNSEISRGEFLKLLLKPLNAGIEDDSIENCVKTAYSLDIISSDKVADFNENGIILYEQAVKMVVSLLNYKFVAEKKGGYPQGYYAVAAEEDLLDNISAKNGDPITKETAIVLINNMLDASMLEVEYSKIDGESVNSLKKGDHEKTVLNTYLNVEKKSVFIYEVDKKHNTLVASLSPKYETKQVYNIGETIKNSEIIESYAYIYVNKDDKNNICYIEYKGNITLFYDFVYSVNDDTSLHTMFQPKGLKDIYFVNTDEEYSVDDDAVIYYNDDKVTDGSYPLVDCFARIILKDDIIIKAEFYSLREGGLIYHSSQDIIKYATSQMNENIMRGLCDIDNLEIILDGKLANDMYDLKSNYVFDYWINGDESKMLIVASSRSAYGVLSSYSNDEIVIGDKKYSINKTFGLNSYSTYFDNYQNNFDLDENMGQQVNVYIDDRSTARFLKLDENVADYKIIYGVVVRAGIEGNSTLGKKQIKVAPVNGLTDENGRIKEEIYTVKKKLSSDSISFEYVQSVASNAEGKGFLKFTVDKNNEISKIEFVEHFDKKVTVNASTTVFDKETYYFKGLFLRYATVLCICNDYDDFRIIRITYANLREQVFTEASNDVYLTADYDSLDNPFPRFAVLTGAMSKMQYEYSTNGFVTAVKNKIDNVQLVLGTTKYNVDEEFIKQYNIISGDYITFRKVPCGKYPIKITKKVDLSGPFQQWKGKLESAYSPYTPEVTSGMFEADGILRRSNEYVQFIIDGKPTDVLGLGAVFSISEIFEGKNRYIEPAPMGISNLQWFQSKQGLANISKGDKVWFVINVNNGYRYVEKIYYYKTGIAPKQ